MKFGGPGAARQTIRHWQATWECFLAEARQVSNLNKNRKPSTERRPAEGEKTVGARIEDQMKTGKYFSGSYLKAADLPRPVTVIIDRVAEEQLGEEGKREQRLVMYFRGKERGLVLNKTNNDMLVALFGSDESDEWRGQSITLWNDPSVTFNGQRGGIRIRSAPPAQRSAPAPQRPAAVTREETFTPPAATGEEFPPAESDIPF